MPTYLVQTFNGRYMKVVGSQFTPTMVYKEANTYPSKYAAKKHLKTLDNVPEDVKIVELVTNEGNLNG